MKFEDYPVHDSIRGWFGRALYFEMQKDEDIFVLHIQPISVTT